MVKIRHYGAVGPVTDEPALALFQKQWQLYRKVVDYNYLFHREGAMVYDAVGATRIIRVPPGPSSHNLGTCRKARVVKKGLKPILRPTDISPRLSRICRIAAIAR
jgi:hypothetical protein